MNYTPTKLTRWTMPGSYFGAEWPEYYMSGCGQSRDSKPWERSNFRCMLKALGGESETVIVVYENHWAVGWVEWIAIHETDAAALEKADGIAVALENYPIIDEDDWSNEEQEEAAVIWRDCYNNAGRLEYMRKYESQFELRDYADLIGCARGKWFLGYASELIG